VDELREENFHLKKMLLLEKKRYKDLQTEFIDQKKSTNMMLEESKKKGSHTEVYIQK